MTQVWFTADTHFGHAAMAATGKGWRPFATVTEHDAFLAEQWNSVVGPEDQVWHLGDVAMGDREAGLALVDSLNGTKHLITGNHDPVWPGHRDAHKHQRRWLEVFETIQPFARRGIAGRRVMLSHLPYSGDHTGHDRHEQYRLRDLGEWLLCGHVHDAWAQQGQQINVGVDVRDWRPISLDEVAEIIRT